MSKKPGERSPASGLGPRNCEGCGAEFQPYRSNQIHCTRRCRDNGPKATATRLAYRARPEVREQIRGYRRLDSTSDVERLKRLNLRSALSRYGVTLDWFEAKIIEQHGACAICGHVPPVGGIKSAARLHVDHDHVTGANRDLLCNRCNPGVGYFRDDPALLRAAAEYIERHRE
jgi:hypothetical protein